MMDKATDVAEDAAGKAGDAADAVTDKIPGETDDKVVDHAGGLIDKVKSMLGKS